MRARLTVLLELTKPRLNFMVLVTAFIGYWLAREGAGPSLSLFPMLWGTGLLAAGSGVLNQVMECSLDARMKRTASRPLPSGRIQPLGALVFGTALCISGMMCLAVFVNLLTSFLGMTALGVYLFVYTPLKTRTALCTVAGAIPGAIPPMMGWAAAAGRLDAQAWLLFAIVFLWQLPHFLSLAGVYREDYANAGFCMLPVLDVEGVMTSRQIVLYTVGLLYASLLPWLKGFAGEIYFSGALLLGALFLGLGIRCWMVLTRGLAGMQAKLRKNYGSVFRASLLYLPVLLILMVVDRA